MAGKKAGTPIRTKAGGSTTAKKPGRPAKWRGVSKSASTSAKVRRASRPWKRG